MFYVLKCPPNALVRPKVVESKLFFSKCSNMATRIQSLSEKSNSLPSHSISAVYEI